MLDIRSVVCSQFNSTLDMLQQCIEKCPDSLWSDAQDRNPTWRVIYHALFFTDLYLQERAEDFQVWRIHQPDLEDLGAPARDMDGKPVMPLTRDTLLDYLRHCRGQVEQRTAQLDPEAASGFHWLPFNKLETQFYNIRHIQLHTGELAERLWVRAGVEVGWVR